MTRAFGDARWKWSNNTLKKCEKGFSGKPAPGNVVNPPYLEATPEIETYKLQEREFLILSSDGLWNHLSNDGAVEAVG
ncbi:uncharacterized protein ACLA_099390 [Aspergillus clavatus NRRL 1]|uniref:PPM-type phosphatase domain-containing protein n=1 Tax=Aspergillus clavatus (strain ATCC 1007 / CBS 513.65 / DSM 816 / NCTC 3887 / NRRL 1 / QM 1276 / 107) TaxID=344612 RepID=A1CN57_ASPCL|nr:uncharacterized protein ACLA_099390 [Aspergillus clavatus NRRL 1]EAW08994.1 hypothetical protein ACLA_099390 [Aspergillus clavatus NRRL 1]